MKPVFLMMIAVAFISCDNKKGLLPVPDPGVDIASVTPCDSMKYSKDIQPILNANCTSCHGAGYPLGDFTNYAATMVKVNDNTFRYRVITSHDMPGPNGMAQADIDKVKCWLDNGAKNN